MVTNDAATTARPTKVPDDWGQLLRIDQAAHLLGIAPHTLRLWLAKGQLPHVRAGRFLRVRRADVENFVSRSYRPSPATDLAPLGPIVRNVVRDIKRVARIKEDLARLEQLQGGGFDQALSAAIDGLIQERDQIVEKLGREA